MDLYASKGALLARLEPVVAGLVRRGVSADALTLAAVPVAALGAVALIASSALPAAVLAVPVLAALRLVLNLLDGAVARYTGRVHARGELLNELGDRIADILFLAPVAFLPGASLPVVLGGVLVAVLASFVGVVAKAAGVERIYRGILAKPGRMALLAAASIGAFIAGPVAWSIFGPLLLAGAGFTLVERLIVAWRRLT